MYNFSQFAFVPRTCALNCLIQEYDKAPTLSAIDTDMPLKQDTHACRFIVSQRAKSKCKEVRIYGAPGIKLDLSLPILDSG